MDELSAEAVKPHMMTPEVAAEYEARRFKVSRRMRRLNELELTFARQMFEVVGPDSAILDMPCGSGRLYPVFSAAREVTMADFNPEMLKLVRANHEGDKPLNLVQADAKSLPLPDASFDLVFCMRLLQHYEGDDRRKILGELARVSRRYVAVTIYSKHTFRYWRKRLLGKKPSGRSVAMGVFLDEARQCGLSLVRKFPAFSIVEQQRMLLLEKA